MSVMIPSTKLRCKNLVQLLQYHSSVSPDAILYEFLSSNRANDCKSITYQQLATQAISIALSLKQKGLKVGDKALLVYAPGLDIISAYFGCLYAGVIAIPVYPPFAKQQLIDKFLYTLNDSKPNILLSTTDLIEKLRNTTIKTDAIDMKFYQQMLFSDNLICATNDIACSDQKTWDTEAIDHESIAFLQYTSGSTDHPKGVIITHKNLIHNLDIIHQAFAVNKKSRGVIWLPPYHDMGLIGGILEPLWGGFPCTLMTPLQFMRNPSLWLQTISDRRATISGGPNFAYDYCVNKITDKQKETIDLSSWKIAFNGAEPIHAETLSKFIKKFESCGFKKSSFYPCYGLAEATLLVSGEKKHAGYKKLIVNDRRLQYNHVEILKKYSHDAKTLISSGNLFQEVKIVNAHTHQICKHDQIGEIWVNGPCIAQGYWNKPEHTKTHFKVTIKGQDSEKTYLRTGDYGFLHDDHLYITGRLKDLIIIYGRNYYPHYIETIASHSNILLRPGDCAAFSLELNAETKLMIVCESNYAKNPYDYESSVSSIKKAIADVFELNVYAVALIAPKSLPRTTSGKIRRKYVKDLWEHHQLKCLYSSIQGDHNADVKDSPQTELQMKLCELYQSCLGFPVGITERFLSIGGDSLIAVQIASRIQEQFGLDFEPHYFFDDPSIEMLANDISGQINHSTNTDIDPKSMRELGRAPLSPFQEGLWFLDKLTPKNPMYNLNINLRLQGNLNLPALEKALNLVVERHEILRTVIQENDGVPIQVSHPYEYIKLEMNDLTHSLDGDRNIVLMQMIESDANQPFELNHYPLFRHRLVKVDQEDFHLILTIHHIIADGGSINILISELNSAYNAFLANKKQNLAKLTTSYLNYSHDQRCVYNTTKLEKQKLYWLDELANVPDTLDLPTDKPRPHKLSFKGEYLRLYLPKLLTIKLKRLSSQYKCSLFTLLLTAYQILLARYTTQHDFAVAIPVSQRNNKNLEPLIGYFVNTLAIRANVILSTPFHEQLIKVRHRVLNALSNSEVPFDEIVKVLKVTRQQNKLPLCQVMFAYQAKYDELNLEGIDAGLNINSVMSKYDFTLIGEERKGSLNFVFEYASDLFEADTMKRMTQHWKNLLESIVDNPQQIIGQLSLLNNDEYHTIVREWNQTAIDFDDSQGVTLLLEAQAKRNPTKIAIALNDEAITYTVLNEKINQLAHYLIRMGVKSNMLVAVCLERSFNLVITLLAIMKAGGAYIPLDPSYPKDRLYYMLEDSRPKIIITQNKFKFELQKYDDKLLLLEDCASALTKESAVNPKHINQQNNLSYVIYTSGTTGKPKGVMNTHKGLLNQLLWLQHQYQFNQADIILQRSSYSFDASIWEIFIPLITGGQLILIEEKRHQDFHYWIELIKKYHVTTVQFVPILLDSFLNNIPDNTSLSLLRIVCGGGELTSELIKRCLSKLPHTKLLNFYGPTETAIQVSAREYSTAIPEYVSIGKPVANTQLYLLDQYYNPVPMGVPGELYVGGIQVGLGYLNQPELTQQRFIHDPFHQMNDAYLYKTGDICRYRSDGDIEYLGRSDSQVKLRGFRIELQEIESLLKNNSTIKEALVMIQQCHDHNSQLIVYFTLKHHSVEPTITELRSYLRKYLPEYMIPLHFICISELPLLPNGKIDYKALPQPIKTIQNRILPRNAIEKSLMKIWCKILKQDQISVNDNFFELGGHSLLAVQLIHMMKEELHIDFSMESLFSLPTIESIADAIMKQESFGSKSPLILIQPKGEGAPIFAVHPAGGNILCYANLAHQVGINRPFYGLKQLDGPDVDTSIVSMASSYINAIKAVQPTGPYHLIGWSLGGVIAHEMAYQLEKMGEVVSFLGLIDSFINQSKFHPNEFDDIRLLIYFSQDLNVYANKKFILTRDELIKLPERERLIYFMNKAVKSGLLESLTQLDDIEQRYLRFKKNILALALHKPNKVKVTLNLYRAIIIDHQLSKEQIDENTQYWAKSTRRLVVYDINGDHYSILKKPYCEDLALKMNEYIT